MPAAYPLDAPIPDTPIPLESFPHEVALWLQDTAIHACVPDSFVACPFLAFTGAFIGNGLALQVGPGWVERPALWVALVAPTGHGKTPAIAAARAPFTLVQERAVATIEAPRIPLRNWSPADGSLRLLEAIRHEFDASPQTRRPPDPNANSLFVTTARIDTLASALARVNGLCLLRDELASLLHTIDRGRAEDHQTLLSLWSSEPVYPPDTTQPPVLHPVLAIVGGIQPSLFDHLRGRGQDGLLERFLLVHPPRVRISSPGRDDPIPDPEPVAAIVERLRPLDPTVVTLSEEAAVAWHGWLNLKRAEAEAAGPVLEGFERKLPAHVARIALILHALWHPNEVDQPLSETTMRHALAVTSHLRPHTGRVVALLGERPDRRSPVDALADRVLAVLRIERDWIARTQLQQRLGRPDTGRFDRAIARLVEREAIEVTKERLDSSSKPVTFYRQPPPANAANAE